MDYKDATMSDDSIHHAHDKLFKSSFEDLPTASQFFQNYLPASLVKAIDWDTLDQIKGAFMDDQYNASECDLLYRVSINEEQSFLYVLFEHQRKEDPWMVFRLLSYMVRIWEKCRKTDYKIKKLPVIFPVVLAQNRKSWSIPMHFSDVLAIPEAMKADLMPYVPDFTFSLMELATMPYEAMAGTPLGILTLRLLRAEQFHDLVNDFVWDESILESLSPSYIERIFRYILHAHHLDRETIEAKIIDIKAEAIRSTAMTIAQQYR